VILSLKNKTSLGNVSKLPNNDLCPASLQFTNTTISKIHTLLVSKEANAISLK
jgi:hypothetical protein